jgi:hypothetical protein
MRLARSQERKKDRTNRYCADIASQLIQLDTSNEDLDPLQELYPYRLRDSCRNERKRENGGRTISILSSGAAESIRGEGKRRTPIGSRTTGSGDGCYRPVWDASTLVREKEESQEKERRCPFGARRRSLLSFRCLETYTNMSPSKCQTV